MTILNGMVLIAVGFALGVLCRAISRKMLAKRFEQKLEFSREAGAVIAGGRRRERVVNALLWLDNHPFVCYLCSAALFLSIFFAWVHFLRGIR